MNIWSQNEEREKTFSIYEKKEERQYHVDSVSDIKLQIGVDEHCDIEVNDGGNGIDGQQNDELKKKNTHRVCASIQNLNLLCEQPNLMKTDYNR